MNSVFVDLDGPVHYLEWEGAEAGTIACLPAIGSSALHWRSVAPELSRFGRVLALDPIGSGETPRAGRSAGLDRAQPTLARFLRATDAVPSVLVGHSMGAAVAVLQAVREPHTVRALVLTSPLLPASREGASERLALASFLAGRARMRARAARRLTRRPTLETIVADSLRGAAADPASIDPVMIRDSAALARAMGRRETASALAQAARSTFGVVLRGAAYRELLDRVECPVLLVHGGRDRTIPIAFAERVARDHSRWRFARFPALGHLLQLEDPQGWSDVVTRWLASGFAPGG